MADMPASSEVVSVIRQEVSPGGEPHYEAWINEIVPVAETFPGHRGVTIIRPSEGSRTYTVVLRFDALEHLQAWLSSAERQRLLEAIEPHLARTAVPEIRTGMEFLLTPPTLARPAPRPFRQFLLVLSVIYPLTLVVPPLLQPVYARVPFLDFRATQALVAAVVIVGAMTYVIMPRYTRIVAGWLYR